MNITKLDCPAPHTQMDESGCFYIPDGAPLARWSVLSDSGKTHTVTETANDETGHDDILRTWDCSCPAARFHPEKLCKHVLAVIDHEDE